MKRQWNLEQEEHKKWTQRYGGHVLPILVVLVQRPMSVQENYLVFLFLEHMHIHLFKPISMNILLFINMHVAIKIAYFWLLHMIHYVQEYLTPSKSQRN